MKQETNMEHSAEWLRGAVAVARDVREPLAVAHYTKLLAAAEAREAGEPSAAEVIRVAKAALTDSLEVIGVLCVACQMHNIPPRVFAGHGTPARKALATITAWEAGQ